MIILGQFDEFGPDFGFPSIREFVSDEPFEHEDLFLDYMSASHVYMTVPGIIEDEIT